MAAENNLVTKICDSTVESKITESPKRVKVEESSENLKNIYCKKCGKKLRSTNSFKCNCNEFFCFRHRFYEQHGCTYDYKSVTKKVLKAANQPVKHSKI